MAIDSNRAVIKIEIVNPKQQSSIQIKIGHPLVAGDRFNFFDV
jgi:hypothetical protein